MKKGMRVMVVLWIFVLAGLGIYALLKKYSRERYTVRLTDQDLFESGAINNKLPAELESNFDPTVNGVRFGVLNVSKTDNKFVLKPLWPRIFVESISEIETKILCEAGDIRVYDNLNKDVGKITTLEKFLGIARNTSIDSMIIGGVCDQKSCFNLVGKCELFVLE